MSVHCAQVHEIVLHEALGPGVVYAVHPQLSTATVRFRTPLPSGVDTTNTGYPCDGHFAVVLLRTLTVVSPPATYPGWLHIDVSACGTVTTATVPLKRLAAAISFLFGLAESRASIATRGGARASKQKGGFMP